MYVYRCGMPRCIFSMAQVFPPTIFDRMYRNSVQQTYTDQLTTPRPLQTFEAKSLVSGTFARSTFSETTDVPTILAQIQQHIPSARSDSHTPNFGLDILAQLTTTRQTYVADEKFTIVLDRTDFGHSVGEVELEVELKEGAQDDEKEKAKTAERAHGDIDGFLEKYRWFCQAGPVEGKLSAYFRLRGGRVGHEGEGEEGRKAMKS